MMREIEDTGSLSMCEETRLSKILQSVEKGVRSWYHVVKTFGLDDEDKIKWEEELQREIEACVDECNTVALEKQHELTDKITNLLEESQKLCKKLNIKMPNIESTNRGMYNDEKFLIELVKGWQQEVHERTTHIENLKTRRDEISKLLGRKPFFIKESPLPSEGELQTYINMVQTLEIEKNERIARFQCLQQKITALAEEIHFIPKLDFERCIISGDLLFFEGSDENMARVEQFHHDLCEMRENIEQELGKLRETLENLWKILEEDVMHCNEFIQQHVGVNSKTLEAFKEEVKRCENIRKNNLGIFVEKLRVELKEIWKQAGFSESRRAYFQMSMEDSTYTEDLLTLHDLEIQSMKTYLKNNHKMFELLAQRDELYQRMRELEERANAPDRFKNRGGQLLKEEKDRKEVCRKIPAIEEQLLNLAFAYEEKHGEKFMFWDDTIECIIEKSREHLEQAKLLMSDRKKRDITRSASRLTPKTLIKTSTMTASVSRTRLTPHNNQRLIRTPKTAPVKHLVVRRSISKAKLRRSADKMKLAATLRAKIRARNEQNENDIDYSLFENELSQKDLKSRSTISLHNANAARLNPVIQIDTPRSVNRQLKLVATRAKLEF